MNYKLRGASWGLSIRPEVLTLMESFRQVHLRDCEAGGQLFSPAPAAQLVEISLATPPGQGDLRRRNQFQFDRDRIIEERERLFREGLHCVGLWHTHPEAVPTPSQCDAGLTASHFRSAQFLNGFFQIIVGHSALFVGIHDGDRLFPLTLLG